eukprot:958209-Rhodomonas_salina.2
MAPTHPCDCIAFLIEDSLITIARGLSTFDRRQRGSRTGCTRGTLSFGAREKIEERSLAE